MKLAIVGSRNFHDYDLFCQIVEQFCQEWEEEFGNLEIDEIISGGAQGTDSLAEQWAKEIGAKLIVYQADWTKWGKAAGPRRNSSIVERCTHLMAFPSRHGKGTQDSLRKAQQLSRSIKIYWVD